MAIDIPLRVPDEDEPAFRRMMETLKCSTPEQLVNRGIALLDKAIIGQAEKQAEKAKTVLAIDRGRRPPILRRTA